MCRDNDFSKAGAFQISPTFLPLTFSISDFKSCDNQSCLGYNTLECQTCKTNASGVEAYSITSVNEDAYVYGELHSNMLDHTTH